MGKIKLQKILENSSVNKLRTLSHERNGYLEFLLLRTDISLKKVTGCPWRPRHGIQRKWIKFSMQAFTRKLILNAKIGRRIYHSVESLLDGKIDCKQKLWTSRSQRVSWITTSLFKTLVVIQNSVVEWREVCFQWCRLVGKNSFPRLLLWSNLIYKFFFLF